MSCDCIIEAIEYITAEIRVYNSIRDGFPEGDELTDSAGGAI